MNLNNQRVSTALIIVGIFALLVVVLALCTGCAA